MIKSETELKQGSEEWHKSRLKGIGSSEIATIMGRNPYEKVKNLWMEKTGRTPRKDLSENYAIKRGTALEPIARDLFNDLSKKEFHPATFTHKEHEFMRFSADGFCDETKEILEIKCCQEKNHLRMLEMGAPLEYYYCQVQWGLMVSEAPLCYFVGYNPSFPDPIYAFEIKPDMEMFQLMTEFAFKFWDCVVKDQEPNW